VLNEKTWFVWEQSPNTGTFDWFVDQYHCNQMALGLRVGSRLPTVHKLASLVVLAESSPFLPSTHPIGNTQRDTSWSATPIAQGPTAVRGWSPWATAECNPTRRPSSAMHGVCKVDKGIDLL
jgi:hypothetical protein